VSRTASAITGQKPRKVIDQKGVSVSVRWTENHHITFLKLGGSAWLRAQVENHMAKRKKT